MTSETPSTRQHDVHTAESGSPLLIKMKTGSRYESAISYSRLVVAGDWIFVSNTAGIDYATREMPDTAAGQMAQALRNIDGALAAVDASLGDVVRAQVFVPDPDDVTDVMAVFGEAFTGIDPALTVTCSPLSGAYKAELEVTAYRGASTADVSRLSVVLP